MNEMMNIEPVEMIPNTHNAVPIADLSSFGVAGESVQQFIQSIKAPGGEGIYRVTFPKGFDGTLSRFKSEDAFLGSGISNGKMAQARLNQIHFDPTQMFMAFALMSIQSRLSSIEEVQREILDFLHMEKEAELRADVAFLNETVELYKFNWQDEGFITQRLNLLGATAKSSNAIKLLYEQKIREILNASIGIHSIASANKKIDELRRYIRYYHLGFYVHSYAVYLETLLRRNFNEDQLKSISSRMRDEAQEYDQLIEKCTAWIEKQIKSSYDGLAAPALRGLDRLFVKVPGIGKYYKADAEKYVSHHEQIERIKQDSDSGTLVFADSVKHISRLQNGRVELYIEGNQIYITDGQEEE